MEATQRTKRWRQRKIKTKKIKGNELKKQKRWLHTNRTHYKSVWNEAEMRPYRPFHLNILCVCIWTCSTDNGRTREKIPFLLTEILGLSPATWCRSLNVVFVPFPFYMFSSIFYMEFPSIFSFSFLFLFLSLTWFNFTCLSLFSVSVALISYLCVRICQKTKIHF